VKIAIIGLGKMGMNMARRLLKSGHEVVAYNTALDGVLHQHFKEPQI